MILLASLSCWILFTLPLGFIQPPPTSCMVRSSNNSLITYYLEASNREQRIVKRSTDLDEYYHENKDEYLEVASNVVFERLRRNTDNNELSDSTKKPTSLLREDDDTSFNDMERKIDARDLDNDNLRKNRVRKQTPVAEEESDNRDTLVSEENVNDPYAKTIDLETLQENNRPADLLEYKHFLKVKNAFVFYFYSL